MVIMQHKPRKAKVCCPNCGQLARYPGGLDRYELTAFAHRIVGHRLGNIQNALKMAGHFDADFMLTLIDLASIGVRRNVNNIFEANKWTA